MNPLKQFGCRKQLAATSTIRGIRGGLLHLVRLFPPEDIVPEPEFRGAHHLPATAVRTVIEQLYALPTQVSYDLRQVSHALAAVGAIADPYVPQKAFERPFSSLLSIEVIRGLREGRANAPDQSRWWRTSRRGSERYSR